jgi:hypothetical protein
MASLGYVNSGLVALVNNAQAGALAIPAAQSFSQIATCTAAANSCVLPANQVSGTEFVIRNDGVFPLNVFAPVGGQINALGANVSLPVSVGGSVKLVSSGSLNYFCSATTSAAAPIPVVAVAAATALTAAQSGSLINMTSAAANYAITLPALASGLNYKFSMFATANTNTVTITSTGANVSGYLIGNATRVAAAGVTSVIYSAANSLIGDNIEYVCDGTHWIVRGFAQTAATFTTA